MKYYFIKIFDILFYEIFINNVINCKVLEDEKQDLKDLLFQSKGSFSLIQIKIFQEV